MACDNNIPRPAELTVELEVIDKFKSLMIASLSDDSIYNKSKETFAHIFRDLQITETEKANIVSQSIAQLTSSITGQAMTTALQWASEEETLPEKKMLLKEQAYAAAAEVELTASKICQTDADTCYKKAQALAVSSKSVREYGKITTKEDCIVTGLADEGLIYEQMNQINISSYVTLAKSYREHGEVHIHNESNIDGSGSFLKGYAGNEASRENGYGWNLSYGSGLTAGYTNMQMLVAERQRLGFEDNKLQHSANSSAQMIGQLLGSEDAIDIDPSQMSYYIGLWTSAIEKLNKRSSCTKSCE